jgi:aspartate/methionine/tyrosine aminotransferase
VAALTPVLDQIADTFLSVNSPAALALPDLLELADSSISNTRLRLAANLATAKATFTEVGYRVRPVEGGWTLLIDVPSPADDTQLAIQLMRQAQLYVHPGWFYDLPVSGTLALSLLPAPDAFASNCQRLKAAIASINT